MKVKYQLLNPKKKKIVGWDRDERTPYSSRVVLSKYVYPTVKQYAVTVTFSEGFMGSMHDSDYVDYRHHKIFWKDELPKVSFINLQLHLIRDLVKVIYWQNSATPPRYLL